jgi:hypothetical protein
MGGPFCMPKLILRAFAAQALAFRAEAAGSEWTLGQELIAKVSNAGKLQDKQNSFTPWACERICDRFWWP